MKLLEHETNDKQAEALLQIASTVDKLEDTLEKIKETDNKMLIWYEQKKAVHEIKKILSETITYNDYDESEYLLFMSEYNGFMKTGSYDQFRL